jgi:predicted TIM-barrel fold metal-dependent hydrolase
MTVARASAVDEVCQRTWMISSDSHIVEPPDLWEARVAEPLRERCPQVVSLEDGQWWFVNGLKTMSFLGIQTGDRFVKDATELRVSAVFDEVRPAAYDPAGYLKENETDGIWGSVIYPSQGLILFRVPDGQVVDASFRAYNDWLSDFCAHDVGRLKGVAMVNVDDPGSAVIELARCRDLGLCGALISVAPPPSRRYSSKEYDVLWAAAEDLEMPLSLHVATDRADPDGRDVRLDVKSGGRENVFVNKDFQVREALADMIFAGVFERHPRLRIGAVEHELGWIPYFLDQMDYTYTDRPLRGDWHRFESGVLPSDFFRANVFASFQEDAIGMRERDFIGVNTLMWGSDYPHTESTFPRSMEILAGIMDGVGTDDVRKIVSTNAATLYHFLPPARTPGPEA